MRKSHLLFILSSMFLFLVACEDPNVEPISDDELLIHYDGSNLTAPALQEGSYEAGIYLTADMLSAAGTNPLTRIRFYLQSIPSDMELHIYEAGSNGPGTEIYSANINSIRSNTWNEHELANPLTIGDQALWITLSYTHSGLERTLGCDPGPAASNGDWLYDANDRTWATLRSRTSNQVDINWNIRAVVDL